jgi:uncharacterized protein YndB with AHSA1/START domain
MKWIAIVAAALVALIAIVIVIRALLPRDHVSTLSARIPAPPQAVWEAITDPSQFPNWRHDVQRVELLPGSANGPSWREHSGSGALTMVVDLAEPPSHLITRIADKGLPFSGTWECRVEPEGESASRITVVERGSVYNPVFRFVSRFIMGHTGTIDIYLRALGRKFGAESAPTAVTASGDSRGI